jgi:hypothetical protein
VKTTWPLDLRHVADSRFSSRWLRRCAGCCLLLGYLWHVSYLQHQIEVPSTRTAMVIQWPSQSKRQLDEVSSDTDDDYITVPTDSEQVTEPLSPLSKAGGGSLAAEPFNQSFSMDHRYVASLRRRPLMWHDRFSVFRKQNRTSEISEQVETTSHWNSIKLPVKQSETDPMAALKARLAAATASTRRARSALEHALMNFGEADRERVVSALERNAALQKSKKRVRKSPPTEQTDDVVDRTVNDDEEGETAADDDEESWPTWRKVPYGSTTLALGHVVPTDPRTRIKHLSRVRHQDADYAELKERKNSGEYIDILDRPLPNHTCTIAGRNITLPEFPTFIVAGTQKGGTSALFGFLNEHPTIVSSTKYVFSKLVVIDA